MIQAQQGAVPTRQARAALTGLGPGFVGEMHAVQMGHEPGGGGGGEENPTR